MAYTHIVYNIGTQLAFSVPYYVSYQRIECSLLFTIC